MARKIRPPTLGDEAIERILAAVGSKHIPADLDLKQLLGDLADIETLAFLAKHSMSAPKKKSLLLQAARRARALLAFVSRHRLELDVDIPSEAKPALRATLQGLADDFQHASHRPRISLAGVPEAWRYHGGSVPGWLAGTVLPRLFELHFRTEARVERPGDRNAKRRAVGPYIRFAKQCLRELGINLRGESIANALGDARKEHRRQHPELHSFDEWLGELQELGGWLGVGENRTRW